jgi:hypothetical protein
MNAVFELTDLGFTKKLLCFDLVSGRIIHNYLGFGIFGIEG